MAAPSRLPSAWKLAERAKAVYGLEWSAKPPVPDDIEAQAEFFFRRNELQTVYLATLIDRHAFAGRPNSGHLAIADLMLSQAIQSVVTTNVDALLRPPGMTFRPNRSRNRRWGRRRFAARHSADAKIDGCRHVDWPNTVGRRANLCNRAGARKGDLERPLGFFNGFSTGTSSSSGIGPIGTTSIKSSLRS